jgi:hypothetical protein
MDKQGQTFYGKATRPDFVSYSWIDHLVDFKYWKRNFNLLIDRNKLTSCKKENKFQYLVLGEQ